MIGDTSSASHRLPKPRTYYQGPAEWRPVTPGRSSATLASQAKPPKSNLILSMAECIPVALSAVDRAYLNHVRVFGPVRSSSCLFKSLLKLHKPLLKDIDREQVRLKIPCYFVWNRHSTLAMPRWPTVWILPMVQCFHSNLLRGLCYMFCRRRTPGTRTVLCICLQAC